MKLMASQGAASEHGHEPITGNYFVAAYPPFPSWSTDDNPLVHQTLSTPAGSLDEPFGLYVHIPFCEKRCDFCYYLSYDNRSDRMEHYLDALQQELNRYAQLPALARRPLEFVYFGGGTPSMLPPVLIEHLLHGLQSSFPWNQVRESTFECAPKSTQAKKLHALRKAGVTRISLGVQDLNDDVLRQNGRIHLSQDVERAFGEIRNEDFDILNVDMISGLIGQTDSSFMVSLERLIDLNPDTITFYQLEIPHNTPLFRSIQSTGSDTTPWDAKRRRIDAAFERLEAVGFEVVSGYAVARGPNPYRLMYMEKQYRGADLLGIGASAFSYIRGCHFQNLGSIEAYLEAMAVEGLPIDRSCVLDERERMTREFILQLKLGEVDLEALRRKFGQDVSSFFAEPLQRMAEDGWLEIGEGRIVLTRSGLLCVDRLVHDFFGERTDEQTV